MSQQSSWVLSLAAGVLLLAASAPGAQDRLIILADEPGKWKPWSYAGLSAADLQASGATAADARVLEQRMKQLADILKLSPAWNPPMGVDALLSGSASVPLPWTITPSPYQPLAGDILMGSFEHLAKESDLSNRFVGGETDLVFLTINRLPQAGGGSISLGDAEGMFLKQRVQTGQWSGYPVYGGDLLLITANGRQPWIAVTRERYLTAFIRKRRGEAATAQAYVEDQQKKLDAFVTPAATAARQAKYAAAIAKVSAKGNAAETEHERRYWERDEADALAALKKGASRDPKVSHMAGVVAGLKIAEDQLAAMPAAERSLPACFLESDDPLKNGLVAAGTASCAPLVAQDVHFFDRQLAPGIPQIITASRFGDLERAWKGGRPKAGSTSGSIDLWTTYEALRQADWKKVAELLGK